MENIIFSLILNKRKQINKKNYWNIYFNIKRQ